MNPVNVPSSTPLPPSHADLAPASHDRTSSLNTPDQGAMPRSQAFSIWTEDSPEAKGTSAPVSQAQDSAPATPAIQPAAASMAPAPRRGMSPVAKVIGTVCLGAAVWWGITGEIRIGQLEQGLRETRWQLADSLTAAREAAEKAQNEYNALSQHAKAADIQAKAAYAELTRKSEEAEAAASTKIDGLQGAIKTLVKNAAAEKQQLEDTAAAFRKSAGEREARLREEIAGLSQKKSALEGEVVRLKEVNSGLEGRVASQQQTIIGRDAQVAELTRQKTAVEASLKEVKSELEGRVASQQQTITSRDAQVAELTRQKAAVEASLKDLSGQYASVAAQLSEVNVKAAGLREDLIGLTQTRTALESQVAKQQQTITGREATLAEITRQKSAAETSLKGLTQQYESTSAQLQDLKRKAADLAEMVQVSESARQAGSAEIARSKSRIEDLQKQVETGAQSIKALSTQIAAAKKNIEELGRQKGAVEDAHKTALAASGALKDKLAEAERKAATEITRLTGALAASEKTIAETRDGLMQAMDACRNEAQAALARLERLASAFEAAPAPAAAKTPASEPSTPASAVAQTPSQPRSGGPPTAPAQDTAPSPLESDEDLD